MNKIKHIVVTRASFSDDDMFEKYFSVMKNVYIPTIANQTCKNFDLCIILNTKHQQLIDAEFKKYDMNIIPIIPDVSGKICFRGWAATRRYNIQTRHDCDDWMGPTYISRIQEEYNKHKDMFDAFLIQGIPSLINYSTNKERPMNYYSESYTSMFLSLCQKNLTPNS